MVMAAPDMKPAITECEMKLVSQPSFNIPTMVYMMPTMKATCVGMLSEPGE